jgi:phage tail sheath gpL-like
MSAINLAPYPDTNRVPSIFAILNASNANTGQVNQRTLIIGQALASGTYLPNIPVIATGTGDAQAGAGLGSMLAQMLWRYRKIDTFGEVWLLPVQDAAGAVAATGTITITGPATVAGVLYPYIAGQRVPVMVNAGDTATTIAANLVAACALAPNLPVTVAANAGVVTVTAKHKGLAGNDIDLRLNYLGMAGGEVTPSGVAVVFTAMAGGSLNPNLNTALGNIGADKTFDFIINPYTDPTSIAAVSAFLNETAGRWSWQQQLFGGAWTAYRGNLSALVTFGTGLNDKHLSVMPMFDFPDPCWEVAADYTAAAANSLRANPALPLNTLALTVKAPPVQSRFTISERNTLLNSGLSSYTIDDAGVVHIERAVTAYQTNAAGAPDTSFLNVERVYTIQFCIRDLRNFITSKFVPSILVADGTQIPFGSGMTTASIILKACISRYRRYCTVGLMQNFDEFKENATALNAGNGLVKLNLPVVPSDQLEAVGMLINLQQAA